MKRRERTTMYLLVYRVKQFQKLIEVSFFVSDYHNLFKPYLRLEFSMVF